MPPIDPIFAENDLLPLSALQHLLFCERQCALIHLEQAWDDNRLTVEGRLLHERVHEQQSESRKDIRIARGVRLRSLRLGLAGAADIVEFHRAADNTGVALPGVDGRWIPRPVEYKRGRPKPDACDTVQLCAQAICLEEMLQTSIDEGDIYYGQPRRRLEVPLTAALRGLCEQTAARLHRLFAAGVTPPARREAKCMHCSLLSVCMPGSPASVSPYMASALSEICDLKSEIGQEETPST